ncbi:RNA methyltransferase, TrmH family [Clostridiales bacterium oral taxon 876 str. F0540]|nr:RNA methyltransferase, TrmH family [Clostridiales bacterium oral taxon 876 str. F0540]
MELIQSKDNAIVKEIKKLKEKKYRGEKGQFIVEGFRFVEEALKSSFEVPLIMISDKAMEKWQEFQRKNNFNKSKVYIVKENIFSSICNTETPQGILAVVNKKLADKEEDKGFYILVDRLQDPGNLGTIIRSAHAAGASGIILTKGTVDVYNDKTLRSTMGSIFNIAIIEDDDFKVLDKLKSNGFKLIVSSLEDSKCFYETDLTGNFIIAVGNEGNGISEEVYSKADLKVKIPMPGNAESLNAAAAASIMIFEAVRQRLTLE